MNGDLAAALDAKDANRRAGSMLDSPAETASLITTVSEVISRLTAKTRSMR